METQPRDELTDRWSALTRTPKRRAMFAGPLFAGVIALVTVLVEVLDRPGELVVLLTIPLAITAGLFVRSWLALPAVYGSIVLVAWVVEIAVFVYLGGEEWASRNSEHWQGDGQASLKLLGQLVEYLVFTLFVLPFVALGVVIAHFVRRGRTSSRHEPLGA